MNYDDLTTRITWHVLSDVNGIMTVAFCNNKHVVAIVSGPSQEIHMKLKESFT